MKITKNEIVEYNITMSAEELELLKRIYGELSPTLMVETWGLDHEDYDTSYEIFAQLKDFLGE